MIKINSIMALFAVFVSVSDLAVAKEPPEFDEFMNLLDEFEVVAICKVVKKGKGEHYSPERVLAGNWSDAYPSCKQSSSGGFKGHVFILCNKKKGSGVNMESCTLSVRSKKIWWLYESKQGAEKIVKISISDVIDRFEQKD